MENIIKDRAWLEINTKNLEHNIEEIKRVIPNKTKIMAIVKANAYGHGMIEIATQLNKIGINDFAVASLSEAIELRENNIKGDILILGYTHFKDIPYVIKYNLIQTVVDYEYANKINNMKLETKVRMHIKINTGMNRIGENYQNTDKIIQIYQMKNIQIEGVFTHLSVSDSNEKSDIEFTKNQINNFYNDIEKIRNAGYTLGKTHIQAGFGILNYPELQCDYVRPGIIMYGNYNLPDTVTKVKLELKPVATLKARITSVKVIQAGESISYGRTFISQKSMKIASVSVGYADGYPRSLSGKGAKVLVNGKYAEVVGRVCMDQIVIDVSDIDNIVEGDIVTLIGKEKEILAENISKKAGTIASELLSRLGTRIERIVI